MAQQLDISSTKVKRHLKWLREHISGHHRDLLGLLKANSKISRNELAIRLNVGEATISRHMKWLKDNNYVVRKGGKKEGYWEVLV